jgi:hypothetical protein
MDVVSVRRWKELKREIRLAVVDNKKG